MQSYIENSPFRLGRTWTGDILQLWIYGQSFNDFVPFPRAWGFLLVLGSACGVKSVHRVVVYALRQSSLDCVCALAPCVGCWSVEAGAADANIRAWLLLKM